MISPGAGVQLGLVAAKALCGANKLFCDANKPLGRNDVSIVISSIVAIDRFENFIRENFFNILSLLISLVPFA